VRRNKDNRGRKDLRECEVEEKTRRETEGEKNAVGRIKGVCLCVWACGRDGSETVLQMKKKKQRACHKQLGSQSVSLSVKEGNHKRSVSTGRNTTQVVALFICQHCRINKHTQKGYFKSYAAMEPMQTKYKLGVSILVSRKLLGDVMLE
jgi:hypothetical protein